MKCAVSLSMSTSEFGKDGVGDLWWLESSISYCDLIITEELEFVNDVILSIEKAFDSSSLPAHTALMSMGATLKTLQL